MAEEFGTNVEALEFILTAILKLLMAMGGLFNPYEYQVFAQQTLNCQHILVLAVKNSEDAPQFKLSPEALDTFDNGPENPLELRPTSIQGTQGSD
ncbi:hypothetical protein ACLOJK_024355 [Asimina triloba]